MDREIVEFIGTIKGNIEFAVDNFVYEKEKIKKITDETEIIYAKCIKNRREGCKGRIIIVKKESVYRVKTYCRDDAHNHAPMMKYIQEQKIKSAMKASVRENPTRPVKHAYTEVLQDHLASNIEREDTIHDIPTFDNMSSILYRERSKKCTLPACTEVLEDYLIKR